LKKLFEFIRQYKVTQKIVTLALLGQGVYLILPMIADLQKSWQVFTSLVLWVVGLAFIVRVISSLGSGLLLQSLLSISNPKTSLWMNTMVCLGSTSVGLVAGGMVGG
jgi:hypothetical protein